MDQTGTDRMHSGIHGVEIELVLTDTRARTNLLVLEEVEVLIHGIDATHEGAIESYDTQVIR